MIDLLLSYYPTALRRVQITPQSDICTPEDRLDRFACSPAVDGRFPAPIPFRFAYFCHAFPVNKFGELANKSLIRRFVVWYLWVVVVSLFIFGLAQLVTILSDTTQQNV